MNQIKKIAWICAYSDAKLRKNLKFPTSYWGNALRCMLGMKQDADIAVWNTNAIAEYEKIGGYELHVIVTHSGNPNVQEFVENGIHYHVVWSEYDVVAEKIKRRFNLRNTKSFRHFRNKILQIINDIRPDLVHVIGIENKFHSMTVLDLPLDVPVLAQLQTLVSDNRFKEGATNISEGEYAYNSEIEKKILLRANYIGTTITRFRDIIKKSIKPDAVFVDTTLPLTEMVNKFDGEKKYDFVYFSANISKAVDWAIEAFILASKQIPNITLDIIGEYSLAVKEELDSRLKENGLENNVVYEGKLPTHEDVIKQIQYSRFALLPLKIDIVSGTIREAMANGLPVVTTITPGTPKLNEDMECVLLSEPGDYNAMSSNMIKLLKDANYASMLRNNSYKMASERDSNHDIIQKWLDVYDMILKNN